MARAHPAQLQDGAAARSRLFQSYARPAPTAPVDSLSGNAPDNVATSISPHYVALSRCLAPHFARNLPFTCLIGALAAMLECNQLKAGAPLNISYPEKWP